MDYETYKQRYYRRPLPKQRFRFVGLHGVTLFFEAYEAAVEFYTAVFGPPAYAEGEFTKGWQIGNTWLTLLKGNSGAPRNVEVAIVVQSPIEAERLQKAFVDAGGSAVAPSDQLMYVPIRSCPVTDPFGTSLMIYAALPSIADV